MVTKATFGRNISLFVARDSESRVTAIFCALSLKEFHKDSRLVALDRHGKRIAAHGVGGEVFEGISMKMFEFRNRTQEVWLIGIEEPIAR